MFGFGKKTEKYHFQQEIATATVAGDAQQRDSLAEYLELMAKAGVFVTDENIVQFFIKNPEFSALFPVVSHVNRTTILTRKQAEINLIDLEILLTMMKLTMSPENFEKGAMEILQAFKVYATNVINDAVEGRKLEALTHISKRVEVTTEKPRGFLRR